MNNNFSSTFAVLRKIKKPLKIEELKTPNISDDQLLIKIEYTYICGSQINEIDGKKGKDKYLPHVLGHEASGKIVSVGKKVKKFKPKDKVFLSWIKKDNFETKNLPYKDKNNKIVNSGQISTFSKYTIIGQNRVYKIPYGIPMDIAALLGCAIPTGFGIVFKFLKKLNKESFIGIYGCGGVGVMCLIALKTLGFKNIYVVDKNLRNLEHAKKFDCDEVYYVKDINKLKIDNKKALKTKVNIEVSGNQKVMNYAIKNLPNDGICILAGNTKKGNKIQINPYDLILGKKIFGYSGMDVSLEKNLNLYSKIIKKTNIKKLRSLYKTYSLRQINKAIIDFKKGKVFRSLIKIN